jgi:hypothetical protein
MPGGKAVSIAAKYAHTYGKIGARGKADATSYPIRLGLTTS